MERNMVLVHSTGQMGLHTMESSVIIISMDMDRINGQMADTLTVTGSTTKCMDMEYLNGKTVGDTKESIKMIRKRVLVFSLGQMAGSTEESGEMGNRMGLESTPLQMVNSNMGSGKRARDRDGSHMKSSKTTETTSNS